MTSRPAPRWMAVVVGAVVLVLAVVTALGARALPGQAFRPSPRLVDPWTVVRVGGWVVVVLAGLVLLVALLPGTPRLQLPARRRSPVGLLLFLAAVGLIIWFQPDPALIGPDSTSPPVEPVVADPVSQVGGSIWGLGMVLGALVALGAILHLAGREGRRVRPDPEAVRPQLVEALEDAMREVELGGEPRQAVLAAYAAMESALARGGVRRRPPEAPDEYLQRALQALGVGREPAVRLTRLYEIARFSPRPVAGGSAAEAVAALAAVRADLQA